MKTEQVPVTRFYKIKSSGGKAVVKTVNVKQAEDMSEILDVLGGKEKDAIEAVNILARRQAKSLALDEVGGSSDTLKAVRAIVNGFTALNPDLTREMLHALIPEETRDALASEGFVFGDPDALYKQYLKDKAETGSDDDDDSEPDVEE